jgi:hypothetical protein
VKDLSACAARHLDTFTDPAGPYAFTTYDRQGNPARLEPLDCLAPGLMNAPIRHRQVIAMFSVGTDDDAPNLKGVEKPGTYRRLREALQAVLDHPSSGTCFADVDLADGDGPWAPVDLALQASNGTWDIKASKVTKILHRKRPNLVPVFDRRQAEFYGTERDEPWNYWPVFQADVVAHRSWLAELAARYSTPDRQPLTIIRAADIVIWTHAEVGCP